jgi:hypothetical protein
MPSRAPNRSRSLLLVAGAVLFCLSCGSSSGLLPLFDGALPLGTWGGDSAGMIVGDTAMHLHVGCTYGDVSGRIQLAANGGFDVGGTYQLRAYPITVGPSVPARFVGHLDGSSVVVTVTVDDTVLHQTVVHGPVTLRYGDEPRLGPCPICRRPILSRPATVLPLLIYWQPFNFQLTILQPLI